MNDLYPAGNTMPLKLHVQTGALLKAVSPTCSFEENEEGVLFTITDFEGSKSVVIPRGPQGIQGKTGPKGDDYVLTSADKNEIAGIVKADVVIASAEETQSYLGM